MKNLIKKICITTLFAASSNILLTNGHGILQQRVKKKMILNEQ